ncbi:hypothetical protein [uncultured Microbacterium sp.]|uniref:hypothetical protein n=1 Tax=Microbacterium algeriense TaxID=2615184 RepID=UPI0025973F58|nr:hypothetical protein [uncultured Microbacterium sp.]
MSDLVVEIHVPLTPAEGLAEGDYPFPWIETIEEGFLFQLEEGSGSGEVFDDGEELGDEYLFFVWNAPRTPSSSWPARWRICQGCRTGSTPS